MHLTRILTRTCDCAAVLTHHDLARQVGAKTHRGYFVQLVHHPTVHIVRLEIPSSVTTGAVSASKPKEVVSTSTCGGNRSLSARSVGRAVRASTSTACSIMHVEGQASISTVGRSCSQCRGICNLSPHSPKYPFEVEWNENSSIGQSVSSITFLKELQFLSSIYIFS